MSSRDVVRSHVEALCEQFLETDDLKVTPAGEIPICYRSAVYKVRVQPDTGKPHVEVYAIAVEDVDADPGLYEALNDVNRKATHFRAFWVDRKVVFANELVGAGLDLDNLACTCDEIACAAHREGRRLAGVFGGHVARPDYIDEEDE